MTTLEKKVSELIDIKGSDETSRSQRIKKLQEIGAELLTKYEIRVNNITIEPLRVEPYFFKKNVFEDKFIHRKVLENGICYGPSQRDRFGKLYIHKGFSGVDIVLSNSEEYAFSFLIKRSRILIDNKVEYPFVKQYDVAKILKKHGITDDYDKMVLFEKESPNNTIVFKTIRNGLKTIAERPDFSKEEQNLYNDLLISSFIELKEHTSSQHGFATGYGGDRAVIEYLKEYKLLHPNTRIKELDKLRRELYPNGSKTEFEKVFNK
ncbi:MAG: hypothetical protein J1E36_00515 [Eubacterium sp.]|nr:hypothetical protein [Eubacterium sp.]